MNPDPSSSEITKRIGDSTARALSDSARQEQDGNPRESGVAMEHVGDFIGSYRLIEPLGEGGFGTVWRAEQHEPIHRDVALKVIKPGMDSREIIARFEAERQALALMDHPNIAGVLDAGTTRNGRPYFVMELVKGRSITDYADERKLTIRQRLELFIPVCQAVQHAHQKAILHRDLKPSNILVTEVDGKAVPEVIDFGIAKAMGTSPEAALNASLLHTQIGAVIGTPRYMSPEQAGSVPDLDTRSDIYTLGVILYELLTGDTPLSAESLRKAAFDEVLRMVRESAPPRPSSRIVPASELVQKSAVTRGVEPARLTRTLRGDLDWIALKALEKERERRYESAAALAADIERHLRQEPVSAAAPSWSYQLAKFARRNRLALGSAAVVAVALIGATFVSLVQAARAVRAEKLASQRLGEAERARDAADKAERLATSRLNHAQDARDAAEKLVTEAIFGLREKLVPLGKLNIIEGMAAAAEDYYAKLPADLVSDVTRRHQVKLAMSRAMVAIGSSDDEMLETSCEKALALASELSARFPDDDSLRGDQYEALSALAFLRFGQDRRDEAGVYGQELGALADKWLQATPKSPVALRAKLGGQCIRLLTSDIGIRGGVKDAAALLPLFLEVQTTANELRQVDGETLETRLVAAASITGKAIMMSKLGRSEEALKLFAESDAAFRAELAAEYGHPLLREYMMVARKWAVNFLARYAHERKDAALEREAYRQTKELIAEQTALAEFEPARLVRWKELGWLYQSTNGMVRRFDGNAAWIEWIEKGISAADRAESPRFDRPTVRKVRSILRLLLCDALREDQPAGWVDRCRKLLGEAEAIQFAPSKDKPSPPEAWLIEKTLAGWSGVLPALADPATLSTHARAMAAYGQRVIDALPGSAQALRNGVEHAGKAAALLRERARPDATEFSKLVERWQGELETKFSSDPQEVLAKCRQHKARSSELLRTIRSPQEKQKDARFAELETHTRESLAFLEKSKANIPESDYAECRGAHFATLGAALAERDQFPAAEPALREAVKWRTEATAKATDRDGSFQPRWDSADSKGTLGLALFKLGHEEEGRKLRKEAAETKTSLASEKPSVIRFRDSAVAWVRYADLLTAAEKLGPREKALESFQEAVRLAKARPTGTGYSLQGILGQAASAALEIGDTRDAGTHPKEKEAAYRKALDFLAQRAESAQQGEHFGTAPQLCEIRERLANLLLKQNRAAEAREQVEQLARELKQLEATPGARAEHLEKFRKTLEGLRSRISGE